MSVTAQSEQSNVIFAQGVELYKAGNYEAAIPFFLRCDSIDKAELGERHYRADYGRIWLASCYYQLGDEKKAKGIYTFYTEPPVDRRLTSESDSLSAIGAELYKQKKYGEALSYWNQCATMERRNLGREHLWYIGSVRNLANAYIKLRDYRRAERLLEEYLEFYKEHGFRETRYYVYALSDFGLCRYRKNENASGVWKEAVDIYEKIHEPDLYLCGLLENLASCWDNPKYPPHSYATFYAYTKATEYQKRATELRKQIQGEEHVDYARALHKLAKYRHGIVERKEAAENEAAAIQIFKTVLGEESREYAASLHSLAYYLYEQDDIMTALEYGKKAVEIRAKVLGEKNDDYAESLGNLGLYYAKVGQYHESIRLDTLAINIIKESKDRKRKYGHLYSQLADSYYETRNYPKAIESERMALQRYDSELFEDDLRNIRSYYNLSWYLYETGNYSEALREVTKLRTIWEQHEEKDNLNYASILKIAAFCNANIGNYAEAIDDAQTIVEIRKNKLGEKNIQYASSLSLLGYCYARSDNYEEAFAMESKALEIKEELPDCTPEDYANSFISLAQYNSQLGDISLSVELASKAVAVYKETLGVSHPSFAAALNNLAGYMNKAGQAKGSIELTQNAADIYRSTYGEEHPDYLTMLGNLSSYYLAAGNYAKVVENQTTFNRLVNNIIIKSFAVLTSQERTLFWKKYAHKIESSTPRYCYYTRDPQLAEATMNAVLLSKGILLQTDIEMQKLLMEGGDSYAISDYQKLLQIRSRLSSQYEKPIAERTINCDSLEQVAKVKEAELIQRSKEYGDYTNALRINWKDVQKKLKKDDVAIEFLEFPIENDSTIYAAMTIRSNDTSPKMIPLFEMRQLGAMEDSTYYTTDALQKLVWEPLTKELDGISNVYFAPVGELYKIGIEYLPGMERYKMYRLSSTRELVMRHEGNPNTKTVLYGGIKYSLADEERIANDQKATSTFRDVPNLREIRGAVESIPYLDGSKREVDAIAQQMLVKNIPTVVETSVSGTEDSFKALSGQKVSIIHLSTHGFYEKPNLIVYKGNQKLQLSIGKDQDVQASDIQNLDLQWSNAEDVSLSRSGLFLAGASDYLYGELVADNEHEDGILTAKEISRLDLRGLDLVVLSACETGLGDVSGDGVFGLQRGFKKAGAQTLLMSLWKVDDAATELLMTEFYRNFTDGQSKWDSFLNAQQFLRQYNNGQYDKPEFWAAFIMLDGIE